jgi:hypothetical protein
VPKGNPDTRRDFRGHTPDNTGMSTQTVTIIGVQGRRDAAGLNKPAVQKGGGTTARQALQQKKVPDVLNGVGSSGREVKTQSDRGLTSRRTVIAPKAGTTPRSGKVSPLSGANVSRPLDVKAGRRR